MKTMILAATLLVPSTVRAGAFDAYLPEPGPRVQAAVPRAVAVGETAPNPELVDRLLKADDELVRVQTLLGAYVIGTTINGPILRREPVELVVGLDFQELLGKFPFLHATRVDGRIVVRLGSNVQSEYAQLRAEFMARLPRLTLLERLTDLVAGMRGWKMETREVRGDVMARIATGEINEEIKHGSR